MIRCRTERPSFRGCAISFLTRLLFGIYFLETGLLLVVGPWTAWWTRNIVADMLPWIQPVMASYWARAGVVALGVLTFLAGVAELWHLFLRRSLAGVSPTDLSAPRP